MNPIGIYEKALPGGISWLERLLIAKELGFDFVEMSVDETDERLSRLDWIKEERREFILASLETGVRVPTMCLSGHRRYPLGSHDPAIRTKGLSLMNKAIELADDLGIRVVQLAGYDVYYESKDETTRQYFIDNLKLACTWAQERQVILAIEIMDDPFINSITSYLSIAAEVGSPWLYVYPDIGNLSAWDNNVIAELNRGKYDIVAVHLKDTLKATSEFKGKFKDVPFGDGCVEFLSALKTLKALDYHGPFMIQMWSEKSEDYRNEIAEALTFLLPKLEEAGYDYGNKFCANET
jgi:L-ribulose-5-phosphate 3-epimerase